MQLNNTKILLISLIINIAVTAVFITINNYHIRHNNLKIAFVDLDKIYKDFITKTAKEIKDKNLIEKEAKIFNQAIGIIKTNLTKVSQHNNLLIFNRNHILAGGEDHTDKVQKSIDHIIKNLQKNINEN